MNYPEPVGARLLHQPSAKVQAILERTPPSIVVDGWKVKSGVPEDKIDKPKVLNAMKALGKAVSRREIADYLYCAEARVAYVFVHLIKNGDVVRDMTCDWPFRYTVAK